MYFSVYSFLLFFFFFFFFFLQKNVTYFMLEMYVCVCLWGVHLTRVENYNPPLKLRKTSVFK